MPGVVENDKCRVATYETSRSPGCMVLRDIFSDDVYSRCNDYKVVMWLLESYRRG